jgi:hypothetical protein
MFVALLLACHAAAPAPEAADVSFTPDPGEAVIVLRGEAAWASGDRVDLIVYGEGRGRPVVHDARVVRREPDLLAVQITEEESGFVEDALEREGAWIAAGHWEEPPLWDAVDRRTTAERHGLKRPR